MTEWWTYRLEDFLLFSPRVYWRMFDLHNAEVWPLQSLALLFGVVTLIFVWRPSPWSGQAISAGLALAWLFVAWSFLWNRYATINWAAAYAVPAFAAEAALLLWIGVLRKRLHFSANAGSAAGFGLFLYALVLHPLLPFVAGSSIAAAEILGVAPDPTAMATLGLLSMARRASGTWLLMPIPVAWCIASWATLHTMGAWQGWVPLIAAALAVAFSVVGSRNLAQP